MYPYKLNKHYDYKNQKSYQNKLIVFIFVWKQFMRAELRDKINVTEKNRVIIRKIMFWLSLWKNLQLSKLYIFFGPILRLLKVPTVPRYWAKLTSIGYKE